MERHMEGMTHGGNKAQKDKRVEKEMFKWFEEHLRV